MGWVPSKPPPACVYPLSWQSGEYRKMVLISKRSAVDAAWYDKYITAKDEAELARRVAK